MKRVFALMMAVLFAVSLVACGGKKSDAGYYVMESVKEGETVVEGDLLKSLGFDKYYVILNEDGTGTMVTGEEERTIKWGDGKFTINDETANYKIEGDLLTLQEGDTSLTFKRSKDTPPASK